MTVRRLSLFISLVAGLLLAGCGGTGTGTTVAEGGVSGTGITAGVTNGFGSIIVNGARHVTDGAELTRDGESASIDQFRVGEVVLVEWELDEDGVTRNARNVVYESELEGPLSGDADVGANTIALLGRTVIFDNLTVFINSTSDVTKESPADLVEGDFVEVSGFRNADGDINATLISLEDSPSPRVQLHGFVDAVGSTDITVEGQTITITGTTTGDTPQVGDFVRVRGTLTGTDTVAADSIKVLPAVVAGAKGTSSDIEGLITAVDPDTDPGTDDFTVSGLRVLATPDTEIEGGGIPDIALNARVEVEGRFGDAGTLIAEEIEILPSAENVSIKLEADVAGDIPQGSTSFQLRYGLETVPVDTNEITQFEDNSSVALVEFDLNRISNGDHLEVRGFLDGSVVIATRVERRDPNTKRKLKGPAANIDRTPGLEFLTILDIVVDPDPGAELEPTDLFDQVQEGNIVEAGGSDNGTTINWDELELDD